MTKKLKTPGRREVKEWIGKTPDSEPPASVKERILARQHWKCAKTGIDLRRTSKKINFDHITAIINGGENRESNIVAIIEKAHKPKTKQDRAERSATVKTIKAHYGLKPKSRRPMPGAKDSPVKITVDQGVQPRARPEGKKSLPPRALYVLDPAKVPPSRKPGKTPRSQP